MPKKEDIQKMIEEEVGKRLNELNKINESKSTYQKVQEMLKFYKSFKKKVERLENNSDNVILKKSVGIAGTIGGSSFEHKSEIEKIEEIKEQNKILLEKLYKVIELIEFGLNEIKNDKYYEIISMKYFDRMTYEQIAEKLNYSAITIKRNKSRLLNELSVIIFPDEVLKNF